jgi:hypothetical protein
MLGRILQIVGAYGGFFLSACAAGAAYDTAMEARPNHALVGKLIVAAVFFFGTSLTILFQYLGAKHDQMREDLDEISEDLMKRLTAGKKER